MRRSLLLIFNAFCIAPIAVCQSFTINELVNIASLQSKDINSYLKKKGYVLYENNSDSIFSSAVFLERINKKNPEPDRSISLRFAADLKCVTYTTASLSEFQQCRQNIVKAGFFYDTLKDITKVPSLVFQKANITIEDTKTITDDIPQYTFTVKQRMVPSTLRYAEDLLQFDSHQFLVSFFGEANVKKDMYYLTDVELKKCSVLFSGTSRQVVFVWNNDSYLSDLLYIIVTNKLPTKGGEESNPLPGNNQWQLKNGIYPGMALKDLLKINEVDFDIYGNRSELAFLIKPNDQGKINFKKTAVMLTCHGCYDDKIFDQKLVSALDVAKANLPVKVFDVVIYAAAH